MVTGDHLSKSHAFDLREIEGDGFTLLDRIEFGPSMTTRPPGIALAITKGLLGFVRFLAFARGYRVRGLRGRTRTSIPRFWRQAAR